jgi:uncharacterized protein YoxC
MDDDDKKQTPFDDKIDKAVDAVADVVKELAKSINHATDKVADSVGDALKKVGGQPAQEDKDLDPTDKMGH